MKKQLLSVLVAGLLSATAAVAFAQADGMSDHMMHGRMDPAKMEQMHARHLSELKSKLKLSAEQEGAWQTFASALKPPAQALPRPDKAELEKLSTPERIDKLHALRKQHMEVMDKEMDQREQATKKFYATLSAEQKTIFDAEHARQIGNMYEMRGAMHPDHDNGRPNGKP